ncbi:MAG TPA: hypothetical protein VF577_02670 [Allosphingosinicella sp.]
MLMQPISASVPADTLFPTWRGREPFDARLNEVSNALFAAHPALPDMIAGVPFERFEAADRVKTILRGYHDVPQEAAALVARIDPALRGPWLCALLLWHIGRFERAFEASRLDSEFALHYADAFHRILDQIEKEPDFADLSKDSFLKDLWLCRVVMIPAFAQVWWPHSGLATRAVLRGGAAAARYIFLRCRGRRPFLEGHTHDPVARAYWNEAGWGEALRLAALALPALPAVRGAFGTAWFYDPAILEISPRIRFAQDLQVGKGACQFEIGSNEAAVANATATSAERRNRYRDGSYVPKDYAIVWSRRDLAAAYGA